MKKRKALYALLMFVILGCRASILPSSWGVTAPTATPTATATPQATATPLPSPTPLPAVRITLAERALFLGDYDAAQQDYQSALSGSGAPLDQAAAYTGLGRAAQLKGNCPLAVTNFTQGITLAPDAPQTASTYFFLAQCQEALQKFPEAAESYANYLRLRPGPLDAYVQELRGDALSEGGDLNNALQAYQTALQVANPADSVGIQTKIGKTQFALNDFNGAIRTYMAIYETANNDYTKAEMNLLAGRTYLAIGLPDQAYARFQDSVTNYPRSYDTYAGLIELVNANIPVSELNRGIVDYFAGQYPLALEAFKRYLKTEPTHDGAAHHYKALTHLALSQYQSAIDEWDALIKDHSGDRFWAAAWDEKAEVQWLYLDQYGQATDTLKTFISQSPDAPEAPGYLYKAARILERNNRLLDAAALWETMMTQYPAADQSYRGLFLAGVCYYRAGKFDQALTTFQRALVLGATPGDQAMAYFWVGKAQAAQGDPTTARSSWEQAALRDPTSYYSERARELLNDRKPFVPSSTYDLSYDLASERQPAEEWLRKTFSLAPETNLNDLGGLNSDPHFVQGTAYWQLGLYSQASLQFDALVQSIRTDPAANFRLLPHLLDLGFYRAAILSSRQILSLAGMDDATTLSAPAYFNHIRFGVYYPELVLPLAQQEGLHPLFLLSVMRQESLFEGHVQSAAGARGLMQIMPQTGEEIANTMSWPPNYTSQDLYRPLVNATLGARYLARQQAYFGGDAYAALAAYNGGPGNALSWKGMSGDDPDLFLEIVRFDETRLYLTQIYEFLNIYRVLYERNP